MKDGFKEFLMSLKIDTKKSFLQGQREVGKKELEFYLRGKANEFEKFRIALGEWALNEFIKSANENSLNLTLSWSGYKMSAYALEADRLKMAIACLGKEAVKKRLREAAARRVNEEI
jgi:hypothetical protein